MSRPWFRRHGERVGAFKSVAGSELLPTEHRRVRFEMSSVSDSSPDFAAAASAAAAVFRLRAANRGFEVSKSMTRLQIQQLLPLHPRHPRLSAVAICSAACAASCAINFTSRDLRLTMDLRCFGQSEVGNHSWLLS